MDSSDFLGNANVYIFLGKDMKLHCSVEENSSASTLTPVTDNHNEDDTSPFGAVNEVRHWNAAP